MKKEFVLFNRKGLTHLRVTAIHDTKLKAKITTFFNEDSYETFSVKGHHDESVCESIYLVVDSFYKKGQIDGRNSIQKDMRSLLGLEDE